MNDRNLEELLRAAAVGGGAREVSCPDELAVAGYLDGGLSSDARESFERHLVSCDECVRLVGFLSRAAEAPLPPQAPQDLVQRARELVSSPDTRPVAAGPSSWRWAAVAAGLLLVTSVVLWNLQDHGSTGEGPETRFVDPGALGPRVLLPIEGSTVPVDSLWIRWAAQPPSLFYEVRVVDGDGDLIWQDRVEGTEILLPGGLGLTADEDYFVRVSAYLAGGKTLRSRHIGFRVSEDP